MGGIERHVGRPGQVHADQRRDEFDAARHGHADRFAGPHAEPPQAAGEGTGQRHELRVAEPPVAALDRHRVRRPGRLCRDQLVHRKRGVRLPAPFRGVVLRWRVPSRRGGIHTGLLRHAHRPLGMARRIVSEPRRPCAAAG
ncbi:hypothetical protein GCM10009525_07740 [Streptosporangium amethystogenes subsp. fukuiense]